MKAFVVALVLFLGLSAQAENGVFCSGEDVKIEMTNIKTDKISISGSQSSLVDVEVSRTTKGGAARAVKFKTQMTINYWTHGRSLMDDASKTKTDSRDEKNGPRKLLANSEFAFYSSNGPAEIYDGDNDVFAVIHGKVIEIECDWNN